MLWSQDEGWCNGVVTLHNSAVMIHTSTSTNSKLYKLDRTNLNVLNKRSFNSIYLLQKRNLILSLIYGQIGTFEMDFIPPLANTIYTICNLVI